MRASRLASETLGENGARALNVRGEVVQPVALSAAGRLSSWWYRWARREERTNVGWACRFAGQLD